MLDTMPRTLQHTLDGRAIRPTVLSDNVAHEASWVRDAMVQGDAHFDRLHQVHTAEEQRVRQALVAAHALLRKASVARDLARVAAGQVPDSGVRGLEVFRAELAVDQLRHEQLAAAEEQVRQAEAEVLQAHNAWTQAARRVQSLDTLPESGREAARADQLLPQPLVNLPS